MGNQIETTVSTGRQARDYQLATTAILYYKDGLTQSDIAKRMGVSRVTVINHLRLARERKIVDIRISGNSFSGSGLAKDIKTKFNLEDVYVASIFGDRTLSQSEAEKNAYRQTARVAAMALCEIVAPGTILGVAWGRTIQLLAEELPALNKPGVSVFQLIGAMKTPLMVAAETCAINISRRFGADCYTLHAPAILSTRELAEGLRVEPVIKAHLDKLCDVDIALFSVGSCLPRTHMLQSGIASPNDLEWYVNNGAVGVICGRFIDKSGNHVIGPLDERMIGVTPDQVKLARTGMLVVSGCHKTDAVLAAIRGGMVTHLVTDEITGKALLENTIA